MDEKIERILEEPLERGGPVPPTDVPATLEFDSTPPDLDPPLQSASREASSHDSDAQNIPLSKQPTAQDWTGPDDPENASNWSFKKRAYHLSMISLLCFATYATSSFSSFSSYPNLSDFSLAAGPSALQYIHLAIARFKNISMFQSLRLCSPIHYIFSVSPLDQS